MTIRELARLTGLSYATVSRALNDNPNVADGTKARIKKIALDAGYQINAGAKSLATGIHMTVGVLYPYRRLRAVESVYTVRLMHMISDELAQRGFDSLIHGYDTVGEDVSELTRLVRQKKVDGLILIGYEVTEEAVREAARYTDRIILINPARAPWIERYDYILIDHFHGGVLAANALISRGRRRLVTVAEDSLQFEVRIQGFQSMMRSKRELSYAKLTLASGSYDDAYRLGSERFAELCEADGLFVQSDNCAFGVMNALADRGVSVPDSLAIVGYDDVDWCTYSRPTLSTIHQPKTDIAVISAEAMTSWVLGKYREPLREVLKPTFVKRGSC
ncbi:MAG: LacI family DNA-binding transcriptional regulator [Spirochaetales bacterium]|nr:LacI family DNA-binding transcriptional regulator [Spirochaetales bacterium]